MSKWVRKWKKSHQPYGWTGILYLNNIPITRMYESEFDLLMNKPTK